MAEGHQAVRDHSSELNCHDQDEGDHKERPNRLELEVLNLNGNDVLSFAHSCAPVHAQHLIVSKFEGVTVKRVRPSAPGATSRSADPGVSGA